MTVTAKEVPSGRKRLGWPLAAASTVTAVFILSNAPTPLYVRWQAAWGFDSGMLTVVFAAYMVGLIVTLIVAGKLADRYGRKIVLVPGMGAAVAAALLFLLARDVTWLLLARFFAGVAVGSAVTAGMSATVDLAPEHRRRTGSVLASASMVLGAGLGPLLAGTLTQVSDAPQTWVFGIVLAVTLVALVTAASLPARLLPAPAGNAAHERLWSWPAVPAGNRRELAWGAAAFAPGITSTSFVLSLGPTVLAEGIGAHSALLAGITACVMFLVATGIQFAFAGLNTRTHLAISSVTAIGSMAAFALSVTLWRSPVVFVAAAVLAGAAQGLGQLGALTLLGTRVPPRHRAEANAALNIIGYIPAALLPLGTGYLIGMVTFTPAILTFAAVVATSAVIALVVVRAGHRRGPRPAQPIASADSRRRRAAVASRA